MVAEATRLAPLGCLLVCWSPRRPIYGFASVSLRSELPAPCAALTSITNRFTFPFMTAVTVSSKYQIVIPKEARRKLGISSGTKLQAIAEESGLRLVKEPSIDEISGLLRGMTVQDFDIRNEEDRELL